MNKHVRLIYTILSYRSRKLPLMLNLIPPPTHGFWKSFIIFAAETSCFLTSTELDCGLESSSFLFFQSNLAYSEKDPRVRLLSVFLPTMEAALLHFLHFRKLRLMLQCYMLQKISGTSNSYMLIPLISDKLNLSTINIRLH